MSENVSTSSSASPVASTSTLPSKAAYHEPALLDDLVAGWLGGALGILASNPLEVLNTHLEYTLTPISVCLPTIRKVRMQTAIPAAAAADTPSTPRAGAGSRPPRGTTEGLLMLWRTEGARILIAGAAAPILGLAVIDSAFFGIYGRTMSAFEQDRQNPASLPLVFSSGALAGGVCALLQTPIEVVKCRAQVENQASEKRLGSFGIARMIAKQEGIKGFYHGGLTTTLRDTVSSGIFFSTYILFRRILRSESPFAPASSVASSSTPSFGEAVTPIPEIEDGHSSTSFTSEIATILLAGGMAGTFAAIIPYPLDIIKTRLQTFHSQPAPTLTSVCRQIYADGIRTYIYLYPNTLTHSFLQRISRLKRTWHPGERSAFLEMWSTRLLALRAYFVGYRPTVASSFIGSAVTITCVEAVLRGFQHWRDR